MNRELSPLQRTIALVLIAGAAVYAYVDKRHLGATLAVVAAGVVFATGLWLLRGANTREAASWTEKDLRRLARWHALQTGLVWGLWMFVLMFDEWDELLPNAVVFTVAGLFFAVFVYGDQRRGLEKAREEALDRQETVFE